MSRRERFLKEKMHTADGMRTIAHWSAKAGTHTELTAAGQMADVIDKALQGSQKQG